jgi:hypothetical protein
MRPGQDHAQAKFLVDAVRHRCPALSIWMARSLVERRALRVLRLASNV